MSFIVQNTGEQITAKFDGAIRNALSGKQDFIIKDIGSEFECLYQSGTLDVQVGTGCALIGGRGIQATESNSISVPANATSYVFLRIDLTELEGQVGKLYVGTTSEPQQDNLNNDNSAIRDLLLAKVVADASGITSLVDYRPIYEIAGSHLNFDVRAIEDIEVGEEVEFFEQEEITSATSSSVSVATIEYEGKRAKVVGVGVGDCTITINGTKVIPVSVKS